MKKLSEHATYTKAIQYLTPIPIEYTVYRLCKKTQHIGSPHHHLLSPTQVTATRLEH